MSRLVDVAPGILVATSRRDHTTTTVVIADRGARSGPALLIDPSWEADELAALARELSDRALVPAAGLATHAHYDHLLWHPGFGTPPRWASAETARRAREERPSLITSLGPGWPAELIALLGDVTPAPGAMLAWAGPDVELIIHDAHVPGHTGAWVADRKLLIAGDMLSDVELPLPDNQPDALASYLAGLDRLAPFVRRAALVVPGHGAPTADGSARLDADRRYLDAVLAGRRPADPRLDNPDMAQAHRATVLLARRPAVTQARQVRSSGRCKGLSPLTAPHPMTRATAGRGSAHL